MIWTCDYAYIYATNVGSSLKVLLGPLNISLGYKIFNLIFLRLGVSNQK